jgi:hypothetical protein
MPVYGPNLDIASDALWDLLLIAEIPGDKRKYAPKSDACLHINKFPHLVLEVISDSAESDRNRMLLQAACLARLGNALRQGSTVADPFIVSAIYIDNQLDAKWYLVYQPDVLDTTVGLFLRICSLFTSRQVKYVVKTFDLKDAKRTFDFIFQLYNFISLANEDNRTLRDPVRIVAQLQKDVSRMHLPALTTDNDNADAGSSRKRRNGGRGGDVESDILSDVEALKHAGYIIPLEVEGLKSLLPVRVSFR